MTNHQAYYSARAQEYDRVYAKPERQADLGLLAQWLPLRFAQRRVLELACGTGYWTERIAPVAASVVAFDACVEPLALARQRCIGSDVTFVSDDAYELGAVGSGFNAAFAGFWFSHVPLARRRCFLTRLHSVLSPSAIVVLLDNRYVEGSNWPIT